MISLRSWRCLSRRAFARISINVRLGESSMNSGASLISLMRRAMRVQSSSLIRPARMSASRIRASADSSRMTISDLLISRENTTLVRPCFTEHDLAKSSPSVLFPSPGRAATRSDGVDLVHRGLQQLFERDEVLAGAALGDLVDGGLGAVDDVVDLGALRAVVAQLHDARPRLDEPAEDRLLGDDLRVVGGVGRGGHRGDQRVQVRRAAETDQ